MDNKDDGIIKAKSKKRRDDTPSAIRRVENLQNLSRRPTAETMPLLEMPKSQRIWRRVRLPLFIGIVLILLLTIGFVTRSAVVASTIDNTVKDAEALEAAGTLEQTEAAEKTLRTLYEKYSEEERAARAWAWQSVLQSILWGKPLLEEVKQVVTKLKLDESDISIAVRAGISVIEGKSDEALSILGATPTNARLNLVKAAAYSASGERKKARELLDSVISAGSSYTPLIVLAVQEASSDNDKSAMLKYSEMLLTLSPAHFLGTMFVLLAALPDWNEPAPAKAQLDILDKQLSALKERIMSSPLNPAVIGLYLLGRGALTLGRIDEAVSYLSSALEKKKNADILSYLASAVYTKSGPVDALALLDKHSDLNCPKIMELRTRCYLQHHHIRSAETTLESLKKTGVFSPQVKFLDWQLAVRKGDLKAADLLMPKSIELNEKWTALEYYFLLLSAGDHKTINKLTDAMSANMPSCAQVIRAWHSKSIGRAVRQFENERIDCAPLLAPRLMRKHLSVEILAQYAEELRRQSSGNLIFEVDRALAVWFMNGYEAGLRILDSIAALNPDGVPLLERLARAYLEMNLPEKTENLVKNNSRPELLALHIFSLEMMNKKDQAEKLIDEAVAASKQSSHPALKFLALRKQLSSDPGAVRTWMDESQVGAMGQWTSELTELGFKALWNLEEKNESEKFVQRIARQALVTGGAGEAFDTFMVQVEQNMPRTGKFKNRALVVIRTLKNESISDPRMSYWLGVDNIHGGGERVGLRFLAEVPQIDPSYTPYYKKLASIERLDENAMALMKKTVPYYTP